MLIIILEGGKMKYNWDADGHFGNGDDMNVIGLLIH